MMQSLAPTGDRNPNNHTADEVRSELRGLSGARKFSFRYELLDAGNKFIDHLPNVESATVEQNWLADIKRTARFRVREIGGIDYLSDRFKPYVRLHLPPHGEYDYVEWPQGVFLLESPKRNDDEQNRVTRDVIGYDPLLVYSGDSVTTRYGLAAGVNVISAVNALLGSVTKVVTPSTKTLPTAKEWEPGTSKLRIINDLLDILNYDSLSFDVDGRAVVQPYETPSKRGSQYTYATNESGLIVPGVEQELDLFGVPNQWTLIVSDPDREPITATYTNNDPGSPTSVPRRGRTISDPRLEQDAVDLATLQAKAARLAFEASQIYESITFSTAMMPIHSGNDVYRLRYDPLAINALYAEQYWSLDLQHGAKMKHIARRVVSV
jgi:hypothetical protein